jgi:hypothetical protein
MPKKPPNRKGQVWEVPFKDGPDVATVVREPQYSEEHGAWYQICDLKRNVRAGFPEDRTLWEELPGFRRLS